MLVGSGGSYPLWRDFQNLSTSASARLAQSVERQALNLVVEGSSPSVGVNMA